MAKSVGMQSQKAYVVLGANGLIGRHVVRVLQAAGLPWAGFYRSRQEANLSYLDITDRDCVESVIRSIQPACVFHCANTSGGVDYCQFHPEASRRFHVEATRHIGNACADAGARLVYISSDYVFPDRDQPVRENDPSGPLNIYGALKLESEQWIALNVPYYTVVRTTNVYGWDPQTITPNYVMSIYRAVSSGTPFAAPSYLWGNPTYAQDLARVMVELVHNAANGIFHVVGPDYVSRYDWALAACRYLGLDSSLVHEVRELPANVVPRPIRLTLNTDKVQTVCESPLRGLVEGLAAMRMEMAEN